MVKKGRGAKKDRTSFMDTLLCIFCANSNLSAFFLLKVGYPGSLHQKSPTSPTGSAGGHIDPEVFCPTSAAAAAAAAFNFPPYGGAVNGPNGLNGPGGHPALGECTPKTEIVKDN